MTARELIDQLSQVAPDTEVISGVWNGKVDTYTVLDLFLNMPYDSVCADFFGTPGAFDLRMMDIKSPEVVYRYRASCRVKRDLEPGCTNPCRGSTLAGHLIYWGKRKLRISASSQVQVPGDRDLAYMNARDPAASPVPQPVRRLRTGCGVGLGHAAAGPEAEGFQTICVTDMRDAQPT